MEVNGPAANSAPFVCPRCKGQLEDTTDAYCCETCDLRFPVLCGIPDFRLESDRYISIDDDRRKGQQLFAEAARRSFAGMLDYYYSITPEVPPELARKFTAHALAEVEIGEATLAELPQDLPPAGLLDAGCSTGGLVAAAARRFPLVAGVDVAFRWLVVGAVRLREAGVRAPLVCANAEFLPYPDASFAAVTATDLVEHLADPAPVFAECRRVAAPRGVVYFSTNNRYSLAPEPHVNVWGVGWLPRGLQASYVRLAAGRAYRNITLRSAAELDRWARAAGFEGARAQPGPLAFPNRLRRLQAAYNRRRRWPICAPLLRRIGPRLQLLCRK
jgi:SAM-dependent methyltransferase